MKSAGNDIVALDAINIERTNDSRFYSKFITPPELALFQPALPFKTFVWLLWSVKEAAYKYLQRHDAGLIFSPAKLIVKAVYLPDNFYPTPFTSTWENDNTNEQFVTGIITDGTNQLYFRSKIHTNVLATIVDEDKSFTNTFWGIRQIELADSKSQSAGVREFALARLRAVLNIDDLTIGKSDAGYPVVLNDGDLLGVALSFAHHEKFVGYSFDRGPF